MKARIIMFARLGTPEDWGEFDFVALPRARDTLAVRRDGAERRLSIMEVVHHPCAAEATGACVRIFAEPWRA